MTKMEIRAQALVELSPDERVALAIDLWDSVEPQDLMVPEWHRDIIRARLTEADDGSEGSLPGDDLLAWLRRPRA